ncbi:hypothetical protein MNEG_0018 [Monoraphidium neglectum]|uniref:CBM20 domain-containing protein n=1 Tax=Monoraphidium neglectum TaxID=145388 RepID=A0A0D2MZT3_9CHLO|nr:hypothetical protein MNEG_0018 [Monoraphidium neglectum]KIZ07945.1 hypothetical protein MNEG_0018 [Monoraphidium neglectum]|eukprot:XP_013906964.1 hypothetical protein MNEG_0018 [Monoraphidium neglectum]
MTWNEGHSWTLDIPLPAGKVTFKVVMQEANGGVRWETSTGNRAVTLPATTDAATPVGSVGVACSWGEISDTRVKALPDRSFLRSRLDALEGRASALRHQQSRTVLLSGPTHSAPSVPDGEVGLAGTAWTPGAAVPSGVGERALGATVDQLLQVAHEALDRGDSSAGAIALGAAECEAEEPTSLSRCCILLAVSQAATAALENQVNLAAAWAASKTQASLLADEPAAPVGPAMPQLRDSVFSDEAPPATTSPQTAAGQAGKDPAGPAAALVPTPEDQGGALMFSADSLRAEVDPHVMLRAVLERTTRSAAGATSAPAAAAAAYLETELRSTPTEVEAPPPEVQHSSAPQTAEVPAAGRVATVAAASNVVLSVDAQSSTGTAVARPTQVVPAPSGAGPQRQQLQSLLGGIEAKADACRTLTAQIAQGRAAKRDAALEVAAAPTVATIASLNDGLFAARASALAVVVAMLMSSAGRRMGA